MIIQLHIKPCHGENVMSRGQEDRVCSVLVFMPGLDFISCEFDG
jgi:hypothetical protein